MLTIILPNPQLVDDVKAAVHAAAEAKQKLAMFHFQILKNADLLDAVNAEEFCVAIGVPVTYKTEFRQILSLARVIRQQGFRLSEA
jgi:hypothetical protein